MHKPTTYSIHRLCGIRILPYEAKKNTLTDLFSFVALFGSGQASPIFRNLTCLTVIPTFTIGWIFLRHLLAGSPNLEVISFDDGLHDSRGNFLEAAHYLPEPAPECVSSKLKKVNLGSFHGEEDEFQMLEYFLKNAKVLEEITISTYLPRCSGVTDNHIPSLYDQFLAIQRLLKLQRGSKACRIVFTEKPIKDAFN